MVHDQSRKNGLGDYCVAPILPVREDDFTKKTALKKTISSFTELEAKPRAQKICKAGHQCRYVRDKN